MQNNFALARNFLGRYSGGTSGKIPERFCTRQAASGPHFPINCNTASICLRSSSDCDFPLGRNFAAIRLNEDLAQTLGINTFRYKLLAFTLSNILAAFAGVLFGFYTNYIEPSQLSITRSLDAIAMVLLGGMGSILGPVVGAFLLTGLPHVIEFSAELRAAGITPRHDLSGVGRNLQDHPAIGVHYAGSPELLAALEAFIATGGLPREEGRATLDFLCEFSTREEFQVRFRWQPHSVAFWDNRCVQHQALWDYYPQTRSGRRVTIKGDRPL